jgi:Winged helix DNA-binding domain
VASNPRRIEARRLPLLRAAAQLLHRPRGKAHPADIARTIAGAQAQDERAGRLAFRARDARLTAADIDRARNEERSLVRTWAMRKTMHLLASDDVGWLVPLFEPIMVSESRRRLGQLGIQPNDQDRALREIEQALKSAGPTSRSALVERLERRGIAINDQTRVHVFRLAVASGIACQGPNVDGRSSLVLERDWLGPRPRHDREAALAELARRYVGAFGPATETDFAGWSGLGLGDVRGALASVAGELTEVRLGEERAWIRRRRLRRARDGLVRLLPAWDTYLIGHRDRGFIAEPANWRRIMPGGGILRATVVADGRGVGTWGMRRDRGTLQVELKPFVALDAATTGAIETEVADIGRFEGMRATLAP